MTLLLTQVRSFFTLTIASFATQGVKPHIWRLYPEVCIIAGCDRQSVWQELDVATSCFQYVRREMFVVVSS
jgi:hypothetical protein